MIIHTHHLAGNLSENTLVVKQRPTSIHVHIHNHVHCTCTCKCSCILLLPCMCIYMYMHMYMHAVYIHVHVLYTLTLSVSCDPLNRAVPSGWNKTRRTGFDSGTDSESIWKDSRSQILTVLSALPLARRYSRGWNSMDDTAPLCSLKSASNFPAHRSHS